ncbi:hypothetical protein [Engelhardtia mirabilis]|uniref:SbsA Ig-like domain-containing protein n=1 Tax=Engelhardtia mirabilis TaxID=2528011 RepID=A0A518BH19_9BACT|nr:hypothetical protein Pla133_12790 [Planctomycetes bacterium Pla133]QDV00540.1 hypothetical protein Pla86_12790 [Planctomycetes bacterium Pla86]
MKMTPLLGCLAALAGLTLGSSPAHAQSPYRAEITWEIGAGSGFVSGGSMTSPFIASISGACDGLPFSPFNCAQTQYEERAGATSAPDRLSGYGLGYAEPAVSATGQGIASYVFTDVVFTDTASPGAVNPTSVALDFTAAVDLLSGNDPSSAKLRITATFIDPNGLGPVWSSQPYSPSGGIPFTVVSDSLSVKTATTYELRIDAFFSGGGNQGAYGASTGWVDWSSVPFVLNAGITADSAQAGIVNNVRSVASPQITPFVGSDWPLVAGSGANLYFADGQAGSLGVYLVGGLPTGLGVPFGPWAILGILPSPLVSVPFIADGAGSHTLPFTTSPAVSGVSLGLQAFQLYQGSPFEWYSSNVWTLTFQ